ncbi:hypothetical protein [Pedobacter deserti]|uniref:hypothetical protein n=1 Tax=Pedobacter deserti TaxID=2817382 RepID=UPI00210C28E1|nr:hypothetical protein [Pedobacter sp. SYSU D00382]
MNRIFKGCIYFLSVIVSTDGFAQQRKFSLDLEAAHFQNVEDNLVPLRNVGPAVHIGVAYSIERFESIDLFRLSSTLTLPKTAIENVRESYTGKLSLSYDRLYNIKEKFFLGFSINADYRDGFYKAIDQSHLYWTSFLGGGLSGDFKQRVGNSANLTMHFNIPVFGLVSRPAIDRYYKVDDPSLGNLIKLNHSNYSFALANQYINPKLEVMYDFKVATGVAMGLFLRSQYLKTVPKNSGRYEEFQNGFGIVVSHNRVLR